MSSANGFGLFAGGLAACLGLSGPTACFAADDLGVVTSLHGRPVQAGPATDRPVRVLQGIADGETVRFGRTDSLVVCLQSLGSGFRIDGPGTVSLTRVGITPVEGSPHVVSLGGCEDSTTADSNGGVILRGFGLRRKPHPDTGQP